MRSARLFSVEPSTASLVTSARYTIVTVPPTGMSYTPFKLVPPPPIVAAVCVCAPPASVVLTMLVSWRPAGTVSASVASHAVLPLPAACWIVTV